MNNSNKNAVLENIHSRKSVRHFIKDKEIPSDKIETILRAGMAAPSARNMQPWEFIVVTDKIKLQSLAEKNPNGKMLMEASCAIIVAANLQGAEDKSEFWVQDASAVSENILLALESMNLGAVWIGVYPIKDRISTLSQELSIPENVIPLNIIAAGYPAGENLPKDKWNPDKIHYNNY